MLNITIDFDKTLTEKPVQDFVKKLKESGKINVYVLTYRYDDLHNHLYGGIYGDDPNEELWDLIDELEISRERVIFTNCRPKSEFLNSCNSVLLHLDDDDRVFTDLTKNTKVHSVSVHDDFEGIISGILLKNNITI